MKNYILIIALHLFTSCKSQEAPKITSAERKELEDFFGIKENVKEISTEIEALTTLGKRHSTTITYFYKNGAPKETKYYNNGKFEKSEPWLISEKKNDKGWELIKKFDSQKRLIKAVKYNSGKVVSEIEYKYDAGGYKIEDNDAVSKIKVTYKYNKSGKVIEEIEYQGDGAWYSKKRYRYDSKLNRVETLVYYYPEDKLPHARIAYTYNAEGDMIKSVTYDKENTIIETIKREITYY